MPTRKPKVVIDEPPKGSFHNHKCESCPTEWECYRGVDCPILKGEWPLSCTDCKVARNKAKAAYLDELDAAGESVVGVKGW